MTKTANRGDSRLKAMALLIVAIVGALVWWLFSAGTPGQLAIDDPAAVSGAVDAPVAAPRQPSASPGAVVEKEASARERVTDQNPAGATLRITVLSEEGAPVARVMPYFESRDDGGNQPRNVRRTDERGVTEIQQLPAGAYQVSVTHPHLGRASADFDVADGERRSIELRFDQGLCIDGIVVFESGSPVEGATVGIDGRTDVLTATTGKNGVFLLTGLESGNHDIQVRNPYRLDQPSIMSVAAGTSGIRIVVPDGLTVSGRVVDPLGQLSKATILVHYFKSSRKEASYRSKNVATDDGHFLIVGLEPGLLEISAHCQGSSFVVSPPQLAPSEILEVTLTAHAPTPEIVLHLRSASTISGRVVDGDGRGIARVQMSAEHGDWYVHSHSGADGAFTIGGVVEGLPFSLKTKLSGWLPVNDESATQLGGARDVVLVMSMGAEISGRVLNAQGLVLDARVSLRPLHGGSAYSDRLSKFRPMPRSMDDVASYRIQGIKAGQYRVQASLEGWIARDEPLVEVQAGEIKEDVDVVMERGGEIKGRFIDMGDAPIEGVVVWVDLIRGNRQNPAFGTARTDSEGRFVITGLPPDSRIELNAEADGYFAAPPTILPLAVEIGAEVELRLSTLGKIIGRVELDGAIESWEVKLVRSNLSSDDRQYVLISKVFLGHQREFELMLKEDPRTELEIQVSAADRITYLLPLANLDPGAVTDVGTIRLEEGGALKVRLEDHGGLPIDGANVFAIDESDRIFDGHPEGADLGSYTISRLVPGNLLIRVDHADFVQTEREVEIPARGTPAPLVFKLDRGGRVWGMVRWIGASDRGDIRVVANSMSGAHGKSGVADAMCMYSIAGLPPGRYRVLVNDLKYRGPSLSRQIEIVDGEEIRLDFEVDVLCTVTGVIHGWRELVGIPGRIFARPVESEALEFDATTEVQADGSFTFKDLLPGQYLFDFGGPEPSAITVPRAKEHRVQFAAAGAVLRGVVRRADGGQVDESVTVVAISRDPHQVLRRCQVRPIGGFFSCPLLAAGSYQLVATLPGVGTAVIDNLRVGAGEVREGLELILGPSGRLEVTLRSEVPDTTVNLWRRSANLLEHDGDRINYGPTIFEPLPPGDYRVAVDVGEQTRAWRDIQIGTETLALTIEVPRAGQRVQLQFTRAGAPSQPDHAELHAGGEFVSWLYLDDSGQIELRVAAGEYEVVAWVGSECSKQHLTVAPTSEPLALRIELP